jgi:hypothetical protein
MRESLVQSLAIILLCIVASIVYGILHDLITAHVCVEYFTIGHPPVFYTDSPVELALGWGVIATWWVGLILGVLLALAARAGHYPPVPTQRLVRPVLWLLAVMAGIALLAGFVGFLLARSGAVYLVGPIADRVPKEKHVAFLTDLWMHLASYVAGFVGGVVLAILTYLSRRRQYASQYERAPRPKRIPRAR